MKERPILFSTPMVQAILEGRKTMTRRIVKTTQNGWNCQKNKEFVQSENIAESFFDNRTASPSLKKELTGFHAFFKDNESDHKLGIKCPYGQPGDVLWVRETFTRALTPKFLYKADGTQLFSAKWKPSIHMPKAAARIWLQVEEIRVERLQDITEADALAEGVKYISMPQGFFFMNYLIREYVYPATPKVSFKTLWEKINGDESWDSNPWVWVVKFKILSTTGKPELPISNVQ